MSKFNDPLPMVAGTLQTDPRSGGIKRSSGVQVLPIVAQTWSQVRDDSNLAKDWLIAGYEPSPNNNNKNTITVLLSGNGGIEACAAALPVGQAVFGGLAISTTTSASQVNRFVTFFHCDDDTPTMQKGRASLHKNGVMNVLEGSDCEIQIHRGMRQADLVVTMMEGNRSLSSKVSHALPQQQQVRPPASTVSGKTPSTVDRNSSTRTISVPIKPASKAFSTIPQLQLSNSSGSNSLPSSVGDVGTCTVVPYLVLSGRAGANATATLPDNIDLAHKERYLSEQEFEQVFGMAREKFLSLAAWKRIALKKQHDLF